MLGEIISGIGGSLQNLENGLWGQYFGNRARRDAAGVNYDNYVKQRWFDYLMAKGPEYELTKQYDNWSYELAQRYAENTASWAVDSLKSAGLNPILAASQGFNANLGNSSSPYHGSSGGVGSVSNGNPNFNTAEAIRDLANVSQSFSASEQMKTQAKLNEAQIAATKANTSKTLIDAYNNFIDGGNKGGFGAAFRIADRLSPEPDDRKSFRQGFESLLRDTLGISNDINSTAKEEPKSNDMHITVDVPKRVLSSGDTSEIEGSIEEILRERYNRLNNQNRKKTQNY